MIIHEVKQNSPEWVSLRLGKVTASEIDSLISPRLKIRTGDGPESYLYKKLSEKILGYAQNDFSAFATTQGAILETEAIPWYSFTRNCEIARPGFCTSDDLRIGCSPDGLIGNDGGIEVKCFQPHQSLRCLIENKVPDENIMQVHMSMLVTGRAWWDWLSYSRQWPAVVIRVPRDEKIITAIQEAIDGFLIRFDEALNKITAMRDAENAIKQAEYDKYNP